MMQSKELRQVIIWIFVFLGLVVLPSHAMAETRFDAELRGGAGFGEWGEFSSKIVGANLGGEIGILWSHFGINADVSCLFGPYDRSYAYLVTFAFLFRGSFRPGPLEINPKFGIGGASGHGVKAQAVLQFDLGFDLLYRFDGFGGHALGAYVQAHILPEFRSDRSSGYMMTAGLTYRFGAVWDNGHSASAPGNYGTYRFDDDAYDDENYIGEDAQDEIKSRTIMKTIEAIFLMIDSLID